MSEKLDDEDIEKFKEIYGEEILVPMANLMDAVDKSEKNWELHLRITEKPENNDTQEDS